MSLTGGLPPRSSARHDNRVTPGAPCYGEQACGGLGSVADPLMLPKDPRQACHQQLQRHVVVGHVVADLGQPRVG